MSAIPILSDQKTARQDAHDWNEDNRDVPLIAVARAVPAGSWGGHEKGWGVFLIPNPDWKEPAPDGR